MDYPYYPGCTLKTTGKKDEEAALEVAKLLGFELKELPTWTCCGVVYNLTSDVMADHLSATRTLIRAQEMGRELNTNKLVTLCSMCYNVLKQVNLMYKNNPDKLKNVNMFMDTEEDYLGNIEILHFLEVLYNDIGPEKIREKVKTPLKGLKVDPYYGCMLLRPKTIAFDNQDAPHIMGDLLSALGATVIENPMTVECCGAHQIITNKNAVLSCVERIVTISQKKRSDVIVTPCPLCQYNLTTGQKALLEKGKINHMTPVIYLSELMRISLAENNENYLKDYSFIKDKLQERGGL
ncbi:MAG: hydrogenase MvhADGHdrABC CoB-CoM heterodisulfide reductase subunit B [Candidatus Methanofastidiosum methylothiophilum]|uniref:Hydrogenase MvhADGHdrABC CoB-CoM heterodisulfide reductase subunit B n=1 Tax=Candidatus Methanofastidiosum methylothiophilum TaxID=1705564 RepID=A0A150J024_9EURY|nr:MAG: hydrogenase MvhADGHdrABC CoB-CoM heterodisulfide reductase subunit B [Candidatus Methanofastidiosum methylthiophilus]